jgi:uncharacterized Zn finger protein
MSYGYFMWPRARPAASRRAAAQRRLDAAARRGAPLSPVTIAGRTIAHTFWGKAWCDNLERYRDFAYRLERGRTYVRSGAVIDLQIAAGQIRAKVVGSRVYDVAVDIDAVAPHAWRAIQRDCAGGIASRLDLLTGKLSDVVMARLCADQIGLFPTQSAIRFGCSCPDYANMCKHVAAVMYGVGARLDRAPELLFALRRVSVDALLSSALSEAPAGHPGTGRVLAAGAAGGDLGAMFGIDLADSAVRTEPRPPSPPSPRPGSASKLAAASTPRSRAASPRATKAAAAPPRSTKAVAVPPRSTKRVASPPRAAPAATASPPRAAPAATASPRPAPAAAVRKPRAKSRAGKASR